MSVFPGGQADWTETLRSAGHLFNSTLVLEEVLNLVMDKVVEVTGAERGFVMLVNEKTGNLDFKAARNLEHHTVDKPAFQVSRNIVQRVIDEGRPLMITDAAGDSQYSQFASVAALHLRSILCAPLKVKGITTGAIYVENRLRSGLFTEMDLEMVVSIADQASIAVQNARLFGDLQARLGEIAAMKDYQDNIFRSVGSTILTLDLSGKVTVFNQAAERLFGLAATEAVGKPYTEIFGVALGGKLLGRMARATAPGGGSSNLSEFRCELPRRGLVWLTLTVSALWDADRKPVGVVIVADDLTEAKAMEAARRQAEEERERVRELFGKYVAPAVAERLLEDPSRVSLGGQSQTVTILFADIRGYTSISEKMRPDDVVAMLNLYLGVSTEAIFQQEGTLDKFMGDAVMAFFNAPLPQPDHAFATIRAAVAMQEEVRRLSAESEVKVAYGIGVNTGPAIVGNIGTERLMNYTVIGDAVNVASRLQSRAQAGEVLISHSTYELAADRVEVEALEPMQVKGRQEPVQVYRVLGLKE